MKQVLAILLSFLFFTLALGQQLREQEFFEASRPGFRHLYNMDYDEATDIFARLDEDHPYHPGPPLYLASIIWLRELVRREELNLDHFVSPGYFTEKTDKEMPAEDRKEFERYVEESRVRAEKILKEDPGNLHGKYTIGALEGILGSFALTIERSYKGALDHGKKAYQLHKEIIEEEPDYYDAYLTVGVYEYVVDNLPWYIKWLAVIVGYRGDEERGFRYIQKTAEEGVFADLNARVVQMVLFVREERYEEALSRATELHQQFPRNYIVHLNQGQILERMGRNRKAGHVYAEFIQKVETRQPNYDRLEILPTRFLIARRLFDLGAFDLAEDQFEKIAQNGDASERQRAVSHLRLGQIADLSGRREVARREYRKVLALREVDDSHQEARDYLEEAYRRDN